MIASFAEELPADGMAFVRGKYDFPVVPVARPVSGEEEWDAEKLVESESSESTPGSGPSGDAHDVVGVDSRMVHGPRS